MGDFKFPRSFGFTGSADKVEGRVAVRPHTRQAYAKGGRVRAPAPKLSAGRIAGGALAAGAAAAAYNKLKSRDEPREEKPRMTARGEQLRQQERDLGLKKGGKVRKGMKNC